MKIQQNLALECTHFIDFKIELNKMLSSLKIINPCTSNFPEHIIPLKIIIYGIRMEYVTKLGEYDRK